MFTECDITCHPCVKVKVTSISFVSVNAKRAVEGGGRGGEC